MSREEVVRVGGDGRSALALRVAGARVQLVVLRDNGQGEYEAEGSVMLPAAELSLLRDALRRVGDRLPHLTGEAPNWRESMPPAEGRSGDGRMVIQGGRAAWVPR